MRSPSSSPSVRRFEVDWVIVSVAGIKRWGLLAFALLLAGSVVAGVFYFTHEPPEVKAQRLLLRATAAQEQVRRAGFSDNLAAEFDQASRLLEEARSDWERKDYPACVARAEDALQRFELLGGLANRDFVGSGQVIALQGVLGARHARRVVLALPIGAGLLEQPRGLVELGREVVGEPRPPHLLLRRGGAQQQALRLHLRRLVREVEDARDHAAGGEGAA